MRVLVLSDVHANLEALETVLDDAPEWDALWFLGDAVGYGPNPNEVVEQLEHLAPEQWLAGNHDWAAMGKMDTAEFNPDARAAAEWTGRQLSPAVWQRLEQATPRVDLPEQSLTLVHGSPRQPIWEYILDAATATDNFEHFATPQCLFGHTHVPVVYELNVDGALRLPYSLDGPLAPSEARRLVNPGSVGQPRDGDPRASYLLLDLESGTLLFRRVAYDVAAVQEKILDAGLPQRLAARLAYGW